MPGTIWLSMTPIRCMSMKAVRRRVCRGCSSTAAPAPIEATGAAKRIGAVMARRFGMAGWHVVIHAGHSILTDQHGTVTHLRAGDSFIIRPGFEGTWDCVETTLKDYVIRG